MSRREEKRSRDSSVSDFAQSPNSPPPVPYRDDSPPPVAGTPVGMVHGKDHRDDAAAAAAATRRRRSASSRSGSRSRSPRKEGRAEGQRSEEQGEDGEDGNGAMVKRKRSAVKSSSSPKSTKSARSSSSSSSSSLSPRASSRSSGSLRRERRREARRKEDEQAAAAAARRSSGSSDVSSTSTTSSRDGRRGRGGVAGASTLVPPVTSAAAVPAPSRGGSSRRARQRAHASSSYSSNYSAASSYSSGSRRRRRRRQEGGSVRGSNAGSVHGSDLGSVRGSERASVRGGASRSYASPYSPSVRSGASSARSGTRSIAGRSVRTGGLRSSRRSFKDRAASDILDNLDGRSSSSGSRSPSWGSGARDMEDQRPLTRIVDSYGFPVHADLLPTQRRSLDDGIDRAARAMPRWEQLCRARNADGVPSLNAERCSQRYSELCSVTRHGVPRELRAELWQITTRSLEHRTANAGLYDRLLAKLNESPVPGVVEEIEADSSDVFAKHERFGPRGDLTPALTRVLSAYALRNAALGYTRSLACLVAVLLVVMDEEAAFWVLVSIVEDLCPQYYTQGMLGVQVDSRVFSHLVRVHLPAVWNHLQSLGCVLELHTANWFQSLYAGHLPTEALVRLWDLFFVEGAHLFFLAGLALLSESQEDLLRARTLPDLTSVLKAAPGSVFDLDTVLQRAADGNRIVFTPEMLLDLRKQYRGVVDVESRKMEQRRELRALQETMDFSALELEELGVELIHALAEDRTLSFQEFSDIVHETFPKRQRDALALEDLFTVFDVNRDNTVDFGEVMAGLAVVASGSLEARLRICFNSFDIDKSGFIERREMKLLFRHFEEAIASSANAGLASNMDAFVDRVFDNLDTHETDRLTFDEFRRAASIHPQIIQCFLGRPHDDETMFRRVDTRQKKFGTSHTEHLRPEDLLVDETYDGGKSKDRMCGSDCVIS